MDNLKLRELERKKWESINLIFLSVFEELIKKPYLIRKNEFINCKLKFKQRKYLCHSLFMVMELWILYSIFCGLRIKFLMQV
jgi:hypothetical protein